MSCKRVPTQISISCLSLGFQNVGSSVRHEWYIICFILLEAGWGRGIWIKLARAMADLRVISLPSHLAFTIKSLILHKRLIDGLPGIVPSMHPQCLRIFKSLRALALTGLARAEWFKGGNKMCFRAHSIEHHQRYSKWTKFLSVKASY